MPLDQKQYPAVIDPTQDVTSLQQSITRLNEIVGMLTGQRGGAEWSLAAGLRTLERQSATGYSRILELTELGDNLASRTDIVEVRSNNATANGSIQIKALTTPVGGATATYQWQLTANNHSIGMQASVDGSGNGSISFTTNQFLLYDPSFNFGTPTPVFSYSSGKFNITGDVSIHGSLVVNNTIDNAQIANEAVSISGTATGTGVNPTATATKTLRANMRTVVLVSFQPQLGHGNLSSRSGTMGLSVDGGAGINAVLNYTTSTVTLPVAGAYPSGGTCSILWVPGETHGTYYYDNLSAGSHTFTVNVVNGTGDVTVTIFAADR